MRKKECYLLGLRVVESVRLIGWYFICVSRSLECVFWGLEYSGECDILEKRVLKR